MRGTIGAPVGGLLAEHLGFRPALWLAIAGMAGAAVAAAFSPMRTARIDAAPAAPTVTEG